MNQITEQIETDWENHKIRERESLEIKKMLPIIKMNIFVLFLLTYRLFSQTPHPGDSQIYYKRKLSVYNFTIYEHHSADGFCYVWDEINSGKGASEIGICLFQYLKNLPETVTHVSTYSDTCGGQNRNIFTMTAILCAVQNIDNLQIIDIKYMEFGHSYLEANAMDATIERAKKN